MNENFLTYLWKFQKFNKGELFTTCGLPIQVYSTGVSNNNAGPDFLNARMSIQNQLWVGNVEIHVKSSNWYQHSHQSDVNYDSVILHVVWEHDIDVFRMNNTIIPTLELKQYVSTGTQTGVESLLIKNCNWIPCEQQLLNIPLRIKKKWLRHLYYERLEEQTKFIKKELEELKMNWEALMFRLLCKNFGMKVNGESFLSLARAIDYHMLMRCRTSKNNLEALLLGRAGLLKGHSDSEYLRKLQKEYAFICHKFDITNKEVITPKFFRLRPSNFPTIRLSQLAELYRSKTNLFSEIINSKSRKELYGIFDISASKYWDTHFNFGKCRNEFQKRLTRNFVDLLIINTIVPLQYCYGRYYNKELVNSSVNLMASVKREENTIVLKFIKLGMPAFSAADSQAIIQLHNHYCNKNRCVDCSLGNHVLKGDLM